MSGVPSDPMSVVPPGPMNVHPSGFLGEGVFMLDQATDRSRIALHIQKNHPRPVRPISVNHVLPEHEIADAWLVDDLLPALPAHEVGQAFFLCGAGDWRLGAFIAPVGQRVGQQGRRHGAGHGQENKKA